MRNEEKGKHLESQASPEHRGRHEVAEAAHEQLKKFEKNAEQGAVEQEYLQAEALEQAREKVEQEAVLSKDIKGEHENDDSTIAAETKTAIGHRQKDAEYDKTINSLQSQLAAPSRIFSKFIHRPAIEKTSDTVGASIARPNAILAGSFTAFIVVLGVYLLAHYNGFRLSGFETIAAFVIGWAIGIIFDLLRVVFSRRKIL